MKRFVPVVIASVFGVFTAFAPAAFAAEFEAEKYPVTVFGEGPGSNSKITTDDTSIQCGATAFTSTLESHTPSLDVLPAYSRCIWAPESPAYIYVRACSLRFGVSEEIEKDVFSGTMGIVRTEPEQCLENEIFVERSSCRWSFPLQEGHPTVQYTNSKSKEEVGTITAKLTVTGLEYSLSGIGCFAKTGNYTDGEWQETITFSAFQEGTTGKEAVGIQIK